MPQIVDLLRDMIAIAWRVWSSPVNAARFVAFGGALVAWVVYKRYEERKWPNFLTRDAATDAIYTAIYLGGFYSVCIAAPIFAVSERLVVRFAPFLQLHLLQNANPLVQIAVVSITIDFAGYWVHRFFHTSTILWSFHRIHHSQTELSPLTGYRFHIAEAIVRGLAPMIPGIMLGPTTATFTIAIWLDTTLNALAHSGGSWTFGILGQALVSPHFHRLHHAVDPRLHQGNYGLTYSLWDRLFRTAVVASEAPAAYGVPEEVPRSFLKQLVDPVFVISRRSFRQSSATNVTAQSAST